MDLGNQPYYTSIIMQLAQVGSSIGANSSLFSFSRPLSGKPKPELSGLHQLTKDPAYIFELH